MKNGLERDGKKVKVKKSVNPRVFPELLGELHTAEDRAAHSILKFSYWRKG